MDTTEQLQLLEIGVSTAKGIGTTLAVITPFTGLQEQ
mgnify:CR=1 FL=1|tara:strand:+ start:2754 stop:2864 length:111 start_codon:yes stop_codon:yes gene_type:complete